MWITKGMLKSIQNRDKLYKRLKSATPQSVDYENLKVNLRTYNSIIKQSIKTLKLRYYESCFRKYKTDMKKTWQTINTIVQKKKKGLSFPNYFMDGTKVITDKLEIANKFNLFFTNIGPNLANKINIPSNINHKRYLKSPTNTSLRFTNINETSLEKMINDLPSKNSSGYDIT